MKKFILMLATATGAFAQSTSESEAALASAREKIGAVTRQLPRYTCLETINRNYYTPATAAIQRSKVLSAYGAGPSCAATLDHPAGNLALASSDRLRLEVAIADNREIDSWPGATRFDSRHIDEIVGFGPTSTGAFGGYLVEVFENPGAKIEFVREKIAAGQRVFEYRFQIPAAPSHYYVRAASGRQSTATSGSFEIAPATSDLTRLIIQTGQLPADAGMCQAKTTVDYQHLHMGDRDFLIPLTSEYQTDQIDSSRSNSVSTFSACHEYSAASTISFEDDDPVSGDAEKAAENAPALAAGLSLSLKLTAPIDTSTAAAGDVVFATVSKAVIGPASKTILIPSGARVRGRISEMRQFMKPSPHFQIGLLFETVEFEGREAPVTLVQQRETTPSPPLSSVGSVEAVSSSRQGTRPQDLNIPAPSASGQGGTFVFTARIIPAGFESKWITRQPKP